MAGVAPSSSASAAGVARDSSRYQPVNQVDDARQDAGDVESEKDADFDTIPLEPLGRARPDTRFRNATYALSVLVVILLASTLYTSLPYAFRGHSSSWGSGSCDCDEPQPPQYFQTSPQLWPGPTVTGKPAFMAQTRVFEPTATYVPNEPLQTSIPIKGMQPGNGSIFGMMGFLSPYTPSPGFGVEEYPLPEGAEIVQVQMLSRHGSRYPTMGSNVAQLGKRIAEAGDKFKPRGPLDFLKNWKYQLGAEILVPKGRQELYDSGEFYMRMRRGVMCSG